MKTKLYLIPASYFGIILGLSGLGNTWRAAVSLWPSLSPAVGESLHAVSAVTWLVLTILYVTKWIFAPVAAKAETEHAVQCCFIGLIGVATMLVGLGVLPYAPEVAEALVLLGMVFTLAFALWRTGLLWRGARDAGSTTAVLYLPSVAGSFVTSITLSVLGHPAWAQMAFGAGLFSWLAIESVLLGRLYFAPEMPDALRPTLGIQIAPAVVGLNAYMAMTTGLPDMFAHALLGYGLLQTLLLLRLITWIWRGTFVAGFWAFTFGITALATSAIRMALRGDLEAAGTLAPTLFVFANVVVGLIAVGTLGLLARGKFFPQA